MKRKLVAKPFVGLALSVTLAATLLGLVFVVGTAQGQVARALDQITLKRPYEIAYQGNLFDRTGQPYTGTVDLKFEIYTVDTGGVPLWEESHSGVPVTGGYFEVRLGSTEPLTIELFSRNESLYLQVQANTGEGWEEFPRQPFGYVPWAFTADFADLADFANLAAYAITATYATTATHADEAGYAVSAGYAATAGYANSAGMATFASSAPWSGITGVPADLADGDDDTLAGLGCGLDQVIVMSDSGWACADAVPEAGHAAVADSVPWLGITGRPVGLDDGDDDTLGSLICDLDQVIVMTEGGWVCASAVPAASTAITATFAYTAGYAAAAPWSGLAGVPADLADGDDDTLAGLLDCDPGQVIKWDGSAWGCANDDIAGLSIDNYVIVAQSGGHFTSLQAALDSITDASADNPYLIWVAPGVYTETVTLKPFIHVQGAGQEATVITGGAAGATTMILAGDTSLRDLTVVNMATTVSNVALFAQDITSEVLVEDVTLRVQGSGTYNHAIEIIGSTVVLRQVTALAEGASNYHSGLYLGDGSVVTATHSSFTARGGANAAHGIYSQGAGTKLRAESILALAENAGTSNYGLRNTSSAGAILIGGTFTARGGANAFGLQNDNDAALEANHVTALGEYASINSYGLDNTATANLLDGAFTGSGGTSAYGLKNIAVLSATDVIALGMAAGTDNYGLFNNGQAALVGGTYTGQGGYNAWGIHTSGYLVTLATDQVTALAENATNTYGLSNTNGSTATLRGGSYTAIGGYYSYGAYNVSSTTVLEARGVTLQGEDYGLYNSNATADVTQSLLSGDTAAYADPGDSVTLSNSRLEGPGGASPAVVCVLVSRGLEVSSGGVCP